MNTSARMLAFLLLTASCATATADTAAPPPAAVASQAADAPKPKVAPLLGFVLSQLGSIAFQKVVGDTPAGLFRKLLQRQFDSIYGGDQAPQAPAATGDVAPIVGYVIERLDPKTFTPIGALDVARAAPSLKTGEVFALQYSTSLPGQVRLENIDPAGTVNDLGTYTVLPDQLNRIPRDLGIKLVGQPGTEVIRFYFYPCLPVGAAGEAWSAPYKGKLPDCGRGPNPMVLAAASGAVRPKALVNLSQPDDTMSFAGSADYRMNDVTSTVALIRHEAP